MAAPLRERIMLRHRSGEGYKRNSAAFKIPKQAVPLTSWIGFCCDVHCQLRDLIQTGVCRSRSCPINCIYYKWTQRW